MEATQFAELLAQFTKSQEELLKRLDDKQKTTTPTRGTGEPKIQAIFPPFEHFDENKESFKIYRKRFENYLVMKGVIEEKTLCRQMLLNSIGAIHFKLAMSLAYPNDVDNLTYEEIIKLLETHLSPKKNVLVAQHKFLSTYQKEEQSITEYVMLLRQQINDCDFTCSGDCTPGVAEIFLRAQFIRGIKDNFIREQILQSGILEFSKIIQKALILESSKIDSHELSLKQLNVAGNSNEINKVTKFPDQTWKNDSRERSRSRALYRQSNFNERHSSTSRGNFYRQLGIEHLCLRCGHNNHKTQECRTNRNKLNCKACGKRGHVQRVCIKTRRQLGRGATAPKSDVHENSAFQLYGINKIIDISGINHVHQNDIQKYYVDVQINGKLQRFEVDSGVGLTLLPRVQFQRLNLQQALRPANVAFRSYTKNIFVPDGKVKVNVQYGNRRSTEEIYVVPNEYEPLLGRVWIRRLKINLQEVDREQQRISGPLSSYAIDSIDDIVLLFPNIFTPKVGCVPNHEVHLQLRENATPVFHKEREIPFALRERVEKELDSLEAEGIITKVATSDWGSPLVVIPKADGAVRLCVDYKIGVNERLVAANYPIQKIETILHKLKGSRYFCRLDLFKAYLHLRVTEDSSVIQTITTHRGTYRMNRLSFGIKTAPSEFNRILDQLLADLPKTSSYFDDIIVHGATRAECQGNLLKCLERLQENDLHLNFSKCSFFKTEIEYLGYLIRYNEIRKSPSKVTAITKMPRPRNTDEVRRFLGMVTYYSKFIRNLSSITYPLRQLLQKKKKFLWTSSCEASFLKLKEVIASEAVLTPFDPALPVSIACDASPVGIAGVLSHIINDGEKPVAFASRSLTVAEQNYSQIDREALAIIFTINHFFTYLYGRQFQIITDNRPLTRILHQSAKMPAMTSARLLRYAEFLSGFNYEIVHRKGIENANVDCLSRAPLPQERTTTEMVLDEEVNKICGDAIFQISNEIINAGVIAAETTKDAGLAKLKETLQNDDIEGEYTLNDSIIFKGQRVVIPKTLQPEILAELHRTHLGITRMKQLARRYCFWKNIDKDIENVVKSCEACVKSQATPSRAPLHHWEEPKTNWERIHIDYAGPCEGHHLLIVVDAKSKWAEIRATRSAPTSRISIELLTDIFATHGFPTVMVSDNAAIFTSEEFRNYCSKHGIFQKLIAPGHPSTNGLAERYVQTVKRKLKAMTSEPNPLQKKINEILQRYRATPLNSGKSPAELYFNRQIRIQLDALRPIKHTRSNGHIPGTRRLSMGERVQARHIENNRLVWKLGTVTRKMGRLHYLVKLDDGYELKRHINQLKKTQVQQRQQRHVQFAAGTKSQRRTTADSHVADDTLFFRTERTARTSRTPVATQEPHHPDTVAARSQQREPPQPEEARIEAETGSGPEDAITIPDETRARRPAVETPGAEADRGASPRRSRRRRQPPRFLQEYVS